MGSPPQLAPSQRPAAFRTNPPRSLRSIRDLGHTGDGEIFHHAQRIRVLHETVMGKWSEMLFAFLSCNAQPATRYFGIPPDQVVELGTQIDL